MGNQNTSLLRSALCAGRHVLVIVTAVALAGSRTAFATPPMVQQTDPGSDAVKQSNVWFENLEKHPAAPTLPVIQLQNQVWRDKPQYATLSGAKHLKEVRMTHAELAQCPRELGQGKVDAKVDVSFVVGMDGRVEDARVIWSSDERFNAAALEAIRLDTFIPAMGPNGAERAMYVRPYHFTIAGAY